MRAEKKMSNHTKSDTLINIRTITATCNAQCMIGGCSRISLEMHDATISGVHGK